MPTRRTFITGSLAGLAVGAVSRGVCASPPVETLSLGYGLYGMKTTPLIDAIARCAKIGYRNIEFTLYPGYATEPAKMPAAVRKAVVQQLRDLGLVASCLKSRPDTGSTPEARARGQEQVVAAARLALDLPVPKPPLVAVHAGGRTNEWDKLKSFILDQLGAWTTASTKLGVPLAIKAHVGNAVDRPERLLWLLRQIPELKIVYDHSHFSLIEVDLEASLADLQSYLAMIQVKDGRHTADGKHEFLLPGDGGVDYVHYFRALDRIKFSGPVVLEVSAQIFNRPGYDPVVAAERSYRVLEHALRSRRAP